jgi:eukaryotic-like serine/threonine-protein kinase
LSDGNHRFGDRYVVIGRAGSGGMAEVYRARDELLGREVALKVLNRRLSTDKTFVERFRREAQSAANLNHPNVVSLFDYGSDGGTYYIVMEFIDGQPLADIVRSEGPLMPERAAEIAADVAGALDRAHAAGLVHRDIKPSNIMINSQGQTKVTDFGIARAMTTDGEQTMTQTGMVIGTAAYLSPEQAQGHPVDPRSDVYSLGVVLYEMLTGGPPFTGDTPLSVAYKHVRENPAPPSTINPDVHSELDAIVMKALAKNPDNRYQTAREFREDLQRFLSGQRVLATPLLASAPATTQVLQGQEEEYPPPEKHRRWPAVLLILLALALLALLGFFLVNSLSGQTVEVPDLTDLTRDEAETELDQAGLKGDFVDRPSSKVDPNHVIETDPPAGDEVDEGGTVTVFLSSGPKQVAVPDLSGLTLPQAKKELKEAGLALGEDSEAPSSEVEVGLIIDQDPAPGEEIDADSVVNVVVSSGPELVFLPNVVGQDEETATSNLEAAGFDVVSEQGESDEAEGIVFDMDPDGGVEVNPVDVPTVTISVSTGPAPVEVPDVSGLSREEATSQLESEGFVVQEADADCGETPNTVCDTDPPAGTELEEGDTVTINVQTPGPPDAGDG